MAATFEKAVLGEHRPLDEKFASGTATAHSSDESRIHDATELLPLDAQADRRLTTRIDLKVIPIMGLIYLVCFLDRTNIANARPAGLEAGLDMPSTGYNTALWIFYIPFVRLQFQLFLMTICTG
jgi:hypothetical protein